MASSQASWLLILFMLLSVVELHIATLTVFEEYSENFELLGEASNETAHWRNDLTILIDKERDNLLASESLLCDVISSSSMLISNAVKTYFNNGHGTILKTFNIHSLMYPRSNLLLEIILSDDHNQSHTHIANTITKPVCRNSLTPIEHAVKLYNIYALRSLLTFLETNFPNQLNCETLDYCTSVYHLASIKQDIPLMDLLLKYLPPDNKTLCETCSTLYYTCALHLQSCDILQYMQQSTEYNIICKEYKPSPVAPIINNFLLTSTLSDDGYDRDWTAVFGDEYGDGGWSHVATETITRGSCDIPVINFEELTIDDFAVLHHMSIPLLIRGGLKGSPLFKEWTKSNILRKYGHLDVMGGPIPYGDMFGEESGVSSLKEFIEYMSRYNGDKQKNKPLPLYIFDGYIIPEHFSELVTIPGNLKIWTDATYIYQFILGPKGSGAPFHYHCCAINSLVYGRKRWFMYPPGKGYYSKIHPLKWTTRYEQPIECVQYAGDIVFVPSGWSHSTVNIDDCIGHAVEIDTFDC